MKKPLLYGALVVVFLLVAGVIIFLNTRNANSPQGPEPTNGENPPPPTEGPVTAIPPPPPTPAGYAELKGDGGVTLNPSTRKELREKFIEVVNRLKTEPENSALWVDLGSIKYSFNDFAGAEVAWKYAVDINPLADVARMNLASLYQYKTPNFPEAERHLRQVIANRSPSVLSAYGELFDLYRYRYTEKASLAPSVMLEVYREFPEQHAALKTLAWHYLEIGDKANARKYFEDFLAKVPDDASAKEERERLNAQL